MQITTKRLVIKPVTMEYLHSTHAYASDVENTRLMMFLPYYSLEETARSIREAEAEWQKDVPRHLEFVILKDGVHIGGITLYFLEDRVEGEMGWVLRKDYWGCGYAKEAALAMMDYAKNAWGIRRIIACCDSENEPSYRLMEKLGMKCIKRDGVRTNRSMGDAPRVEWTCEIWL